MHAGASPNPKRARAGENIANEHTLMPPEISSARRSMTPTGLLLVLLVRASALHVRFAVTTGAPLVPLQSFGTSGGSVNVSLQLTPLACIGSNVSFDSDCWDTLDGVYLALFNYQQWRSVTSRMWSGLNPYHECPQASSSGTDKDNDVCVRAHREEYSSCWEPATGWTALSLLEWQEAPSNAAGVAQLSFGGTERFAGDVTAGGWSLASATAPAASGSSPPPASPATPAEPTANSATHSLAFDVRFALPHRHDLYRLAIYNCIEASPRSVLHVGGEASFVGGSGETISSTERDEIIVRLCFLVFALAAAGGLAALNLHHRATALPLHWLLVLALLLRALQVGLLLALQLSSALLDARMPANGAVPADVAYLESDTGLVYYASNAHSAGDDGGGNGYDRSAVQPDGSPSPSEFPSALPAARMDSAEWHAEQVCVFASSATEHLASMLVIVVLLAVAAGRHFLSPRLPQREKEALSAAFVLYFTFGVVQESCGQHVLCSIFVLCFQVVRILLVFAVMVFLNSTSEAFRRQSGHQWPRLQADLTRIICYRNLRFRVLMVFLILPIVFMFFEVVLDWRGELTRGSPCISPRPAELRPHSSRLARRPRAAATYATTHAPQNLHVVDCSAAVS